MFGAALMATAGVDHCIRNPLDPVCSGIQQHRTYAAVQWLPATSGPGSTPGQQVVTSTIPSPTPAPSVTPTPSPFPAGPFTFATPSAWYTKWWVWVLLAGAGYVGYKYVLKK